MAYNGTQKLNNEPIVICTYTGSLTVEDVQASSPEIEQYFLEAQSTFNVLIIDTRRCDASFQDMLKLLKMDDEPPEEFQGESIEVRILMVGTSAMAKFYVSAAQQQQFGGHSIPLFAHLDDAVEAARTMIRTHQEEQAQRKQVG